MNIAEHGIKIFSGSASQELTEKICQKLDIPVAQAKTGRFPNGEAMVEILESVRGEDCFIVQSTCPPVDQNLMELMLMVDALKRANAHSIVAIIPYFGYSKQDKKKTGREPISAKVVANMLETVGVEHLITIDLHATQIEGFFSIPVDNLTSVQLFADYFLKENIGDVAVVAPDAGGTKRARNLANAMEARRLAIIDKHRKDYSKAQSMNVVGLVTDMHAVLIDDFIDTGGTMVEAVKALHGHEANSVRIAITHPLLTPPAPERLRNSQIEELVVTDTIPIPADRMFDRIKVLTVADMLADAIQRIVGKSSLEVYRTNR